MGLITFTKEAGKKIFSKKEEEAPAEEKATLKSGALLAHVQLLELPLKTLKICLKADHSVEISGEVTQQTDAEKIALTVGNVEGVESVNNNMTVVAPAPDSHYHAMVLGDWLSKIAKTYYDHANKYNVIFDANKPMLQDPDEIYLGQVLRIPNL